MASEKNALAGSFALHIARSGRSKTWTIGVQHLSTIPIRTLKVEVEIYNSKKPQESIVKHIAQPFPQNMRHRIAMYRGLLLVIHDSTIKRIQSRGKLFDYRVHMHYSPTFTTSLNSLLGYTVTGNETSEWNKWSYLETVPIYIRYITFNVFSANNLTRKLYYFHSMEG